MMWLVLLLSSWVMAMSPTDHWSTGVSIEDRHADFRNSEILLQPAGTWQTLFGVVLPGRDPTRFWRHCVHAKLPSNRRAGIIRITAAGMEESCKGQWDKPILWETVDVRQLQFSIEGQEIRLWWDDGRSHVARTRLQDVAGAYLLSPDAIQGKWPAPAPLLADETPCKLEDGTCQHCRRGVVRVMGNKSEYMCGVDRCGEKDRPACSRGTRWQRSRGPFACRGENSHVFCEEGLRVVCLGDQAFCQ